MHQYSLLAGTQGGGQFAAFPRPYSSVKWGWEGGSDGKGEKKEMCRGGGRQKGANKLVSKGISIVRLNIVTVRCGDTAPRCKSLERLSISTVRPPTDFY